MTTATTTMPMKTKVFLLLIMAVTLLVGSLAVTPNRANGFSYFDYGSTGYPLGASPIKVCLESGGFTTSLDDIAVQSAVNAWNAQVFDRPVQVDCFGAVIHIKSPWQWDSSIMGGDPMVTERYIAFNVRHANIFVNPAYAETFWFYTANQNCYPPNCAKHVDYYSAILHEIGHALGLGHNAAGLPLVNGQRQGECIGGAYFANPAPKCDNDFYSVDIMYWAAADGYRRFIQQDSINGLGALGYRS